MTVIGSSTMTKVKYGNNKDDSENDNSTINVNDNDNDKMLRLCILYSSPHLQLVHHESGGTVYYV